MKIRIALFVLFLLWFGLAGFLGECITTIVSGWVGFMKFVFYNLMMMVMGMILCELFRNERRW